MKISRRRLSAFRNFGKPRADGKMLSETSENSAPTGKRFPKLREVPRRRENAFRNFGKLRADGKTLSEATEYLLLAGNTKKAATITCDSFTSFYKINRLSQERNQDTGSHSRTDNPRNVTCHAILKHMVLRIIFQRNLIGHTRCHRHGT